MVNSKKNLPCKHVDSQVKMQRGDYGLIDEILCSEFRELSQMKEYDLSIKQLDWLEKFVEAYKEYGRSGIWDDEMDSEKRKQMLVELRKMIQDTSSKLYTHVSACIDNDNLYERAMPILVNDIFKFDIILERYGRRQ